MKEVKDWEKSILGKEVLKKPWGHIASELQSWDLNPGWHQSPAPNSCTVGLSERCHPWPRDLRVRAEDRP